MNAFRAFPIHSVSMGYTGVISRYPQALLAYADHLLPSTVFRWTGAAFRTVPTLGAKADVRPFFEARAKSSWPSQKILGDTLVYRWNGAALC